MQNPTKQGISDLKGCLSVLKGRGARKRAKNEVKTSTYNELPVSPLKKLKPLLAKRFVRLASVLHYALSPRRSPRRDGCRAVWRGGRRGYPAREAGRLERPRRKAAERAGGG